MLPVPYLSTHVAELFAYVGARFEAAARIEGFVYCKLGPVATTTPAGLPVWGPRSAPGSVCRPTLLPFTDATARALNGLCIAGWQPVATAPGSVFVDPRCRPLC